MEEKERISGHYVSIRIKMWEWKDCGRRVLWFLISFGPTRRILGLGSSLFTRVGETTHTTTTTLNVGRGWKVRANSPRICLRSCPCSTVNYFQCVGRTRCDPRSGLDGGCRGTTDRGRLSVFSFFV